MTAMQNYYLFKKSWVYGFQLAEGDILIRLDDDDLLMPNTLEYINSVYELNNDLDFTYGSSQFFKDLGQKQLLLKFAKLKIIK
jgi:hypothetical protein